MAACKLYIRSGNQDWCLGSFPNREKAEEHWHFIYNDLINRYGTDITPIYVETGKG